MNSSAMQQVPKWRILVMSIAVPLVMVGVWLGYQALDSVGVVVKTADAKVLGKQHFDGTTSYSTKIIGGRPMIQGTESSDYWVVELEVEGEKTFGFVSADRVDKIEVGSELPIRYRRTRLTQRLEIVDL